MGRHATSTEQDAPVGPQPGAFDRIASRSTTDAIAELISDNRLTYTWVVAEKIQALVAQIAADTTRHEVELVEDTEWRGGGFLRPECQGCDWVGFAGSKDSCYEGIAGHHEYVGWKP